MEISRTEKSILVDFIVDKLVHGKPAPYLDSEFHDDMEWWYITDRGHVGLNLRNPEHVVGKVVTEFATEHNPSWGVEFLNLTDLFEETHFVFHVLQTAKGRTAIKDLKKRLLKENNSEVKTKHKAELKQILHKLETLMSRRDYLVSELGK